MIGNSNCIICTNPFILNVPNKKTCSKKCRDRKNLMNRVRFIERERMNDVMFDRGAIIY